MKNRCFTLIGISNIGKSRYAKMLADSGLRVICVDLEIRRKLSRDLFMKFDSDEEMTLWLGQPHEDRYFVTQKLYLKKETEVMKEALDEIGESESELFIDSTGSLIHLDEEVLAEVKQHTTVVLLDASDEFVIRSVVNLTKDLKPLIWMNEYNRLLGESHESALARCYERVASKRLPMYRELADISIPYEEHRDPNFNLEKFLDRIGLRLQPR